MPIPFSCEHCGHPMEVDDRLAGKRGKCKHCGRPVVVPVPTAESESASGRAGSNPAPLRLKPLEGAEPTEHAERLLAAAPPLSIRPMEAEPQVVAAMISHPDEPLLPPRHASREANYTVLDPHRVTSSRSSSGPPGAVTLLPVRSAHWVAANLRTLRDWLYVVSLAFLVLVLIAYLFHWKALLHLGAAGVVASNVSMLYVGVAYLVTLPFKESLKQGLANLLIPFYAIYYWWSRWPRMKPAVYKTLGSFVPIALAGLAYLVYEEAPAVKAAVERELPTLERKLDRATATLESKSKAALGPLGEKVEMPTLLKSEETGPRSIPQ